MKNEEKHGGKDPLMDAVQLEIEMEKRKIKEEIVVSEFRERHELDVKMELTTEKQIMGSSDGNFGEKLKAIDPVISGVDDFQQIDSNPPKSNVNEGGEEQQIHGVAIEKQIHGDKQQNPNFVQVIPCSGICGMKRKAEKSVQTDEETASIASKESHKNKWYCSLCDVSATSAGGWNLHIHGKKHKAKESLSTSSKTASNISVPMKQAKTQAQPMEEQKAKMKPMDEQKAQAHPMEEQKAQIKPMEEQKVQVQPMEEETSLSQPMKKNESQEQLVEEEKTEGTKKWECSLCQVSATSEILLISHLKGRKHKAKEIQLRISQGITDVKEKSEVSHEWFCSLCNVSAASENNLNDHFKGKKHKAKAGLLKEETDNLDGNTSNETKHKEKIETEKLEEIGKGVIKELVKVWFCKTCNEQAKDEEGMVNHRKSSKHMNKLHKNGGGVIVVTSILTEEVKGEKDSPTL